MNNQTKYCLLVEDDPDDQEIFLEALHSICSSAACYVVSNGKEAIQWLLEHRLTPDYIFTDINMPCMDGFELLRSVKAMEQFKNIPVVIYSGEYSEQNTKHAESLGASALYAKARLGALKEILRKYFPEASNQTPGPEPKNGKYSFRTHRQK
jgi:CheY-like chemotaxis protein